MVEKDCGPIFAVLKNEVRGSSFDGNGSVVQLVRMPPCHGGGRGFESRPVRKKVLIDQSLFCFMPHYVYILQSELDGSFYKGYTSNTALRLQQHNNRESVYTAGKVPWKLVYVEELDSKTEALKREKNLKKATLERILALLSHSKNIVTRFPVE